MLNRREGVLRISVQRPIPLVALAITIAAAATLLAGGGSVGGQLVRLAASVAALGFAFHGWRASEGRVRSARFWIVLAVAIWLVSELGRLVTTLTGQESPLVVLSLVALAVCAGATYITAAHGRMRAVDEAALYLDAASVFFGLVAAVLVIGTSLNVKADALGILTHAAFFVAILAATLLLDLSTRVPLRFAGAWEILAGLGLGALGYLGLLIPAAKGVDPVFHTVIGAGAMLVGHGGSTWTTDEDHSPRYIAIAGYLRAGLPLGSIVVSAAIGILLINSPALVGESLRVGIAISLGFVAVAVVARQTLLLIDRERVLGRERRLSDELTVAEAQYRSVVERVPGVVYVAEPGSIGRWHFVSAKVQELLGYSAEEWTADPSMWMSRMHPADRDRMVQAELQDRERIEDVGRWEYRLIARDGRVVWVIDDEAIISRDADGRPSMVQGILVDISDRKDLEDQLRHQALHDPLTGLPNRVLFVDRLSHALVRRGNPGTGLAVLFVDLDDFKEINDTLGHGAGDEMLVMVAARLAGVIRAEDTVGRLGGDEFAFLLEDSSPESAVHVADRILAALAEPFELGARTATLTASIGIATRSRLAHDGDATAIADDLLRDADTAMYAAKSLGKGRVRVFDRHMQDPMSRRREIRAALEHALEHDELVLEYQPIVDLETRTAFGLEALVRWDHPQLGRLMPADFVPVAEECGLISRLGAWVLSRACADLAGSGTLVSVNVSAHQLGSGDLPGRVADVLRTTGIAPARLLLELTESTLASAGAGAETELQAIQALGVRIALDDFGSGYSSLEYLGRLPIDILKIDRSLVERVHAEPQRQEVLRAIVHIAEKLGLETIVEGVEHEAQRTTLLALGLRQAQGFLFSPAMPLIEALQRFELRQAS
jgi:diguanylate cyclase (GGDEF)-like protein/PAS domain S-box-containing protein